MTQLETVEQLETFLTQNPNSAILKHSTSCPISSCAYRELASFTSKNNYPTAIILVIETRPLSNYLAEMSGVVHQSPQVLLFRKGKCHKHFSHFDITTANIQATL